MMAVNPIRIDFDFGKNFEINVNDWEIAPCPICMALITDEIWKNVASKLKQTLETYYSSIWDNDDYEDFLWKEYEDIVLETKCVFYYEDMTDEEYKEYKKADDIQRKEIARKFLEKLK